MNATKEIVEDMKTQEKVQKLGRLRIISEAAKKALIKKERQEAVKMGATMTKAEKKAARKADKKPGALVEVKEKVKKSERLGEDKLLAKYPHMVKGSLGYDKLAHKATATIRCQSGKSEECTKTRDVYTSDLFQINKCVHCTKLARNKARNKELTKLGKKHGSINKARVERKKARKAVTV